MKYIEIPIPKAMLILTEAEVLQLVKQDENVFMNALKRGKAFKRADTQRSRERLKYEQEGGREGTQ